MQYRATYGRCAVCFDSLNLPYPDDECVRMLVSLGFMPVESDVLASARSLIGKAGWRRKVLSRDAPETVNCSTFVKWAYGRRGIWIPRRAIQQREFGQVVPLDELAIGDVIFVSGRHSCWYDEGDGVGHVGLYSGKNTVVQAGGVRKAVEEVTLASFLKSGGFRGARRHLPQGKKVHTFLIPPEREVEWSDDLRWLILENFG